MTFRALVLTQGADRKVSGAIETLAEDRLPAGDVVVAIDYSTLNYKDGLVLTSGADWSRPGPMSVASTLPGPSRHPRTLHSRRATRSC
jgi:acrylyl-CoA reductase (NADPH)